MEEIVKAKMFHDDDEASFQILEPDIDQQYIPERVSTDRRVKVAAEPTASMLQKPPVIIVEKTVAQPSRAAAAAEGQTGAAAGVALGNSQQQPTIVEIVKKEAEPRIVNIIDEPAKNASKETSAWWEQRMYDVVSLIIRFFSMAIVSFLLFVWINPPFVQEKNDFATFDIQKKPASLSRAAVAAGLAGLAFILLPAIWNFFTSKFFPDDILAAAGIRKK